MSSSEKVLEEAEYERMARELEAMAATIKSRPEVNHHFAERLTLLAKQMREDFARTYPHPKKAG